MNRVHFLPVDYLIFKKKKPYALQNPSCNRTRTIDWPQKSLSVRVDTRDTVPVMIRSMIKIERIVYIILATKPVDGRFLMS